MSLREFSAGDGAAIAEESAAPAALEMFAMLDLAYVVASRTNPRTTFNEAKMAELTESIRISDVHQPVLVRPLPASRRVDELEQLPRDGGRMPTHEIVSGERRFRASKAAGKATIPAMIRDLTDNQVLEIQIVENLQRDDLSELEEAEGYQRLCDTTGITKDVVGERIGKSRSYVYGRMKLLDLTPNAREALRTGDIDGSKALLIARIPDEKQQLKALAEATRKDHQGSPALSFRALKSWVEMNVMLKLATARFDIVDASLVPTAGGCPACPKRTGANPDLFSDVEGPDLCIDAPCFHAKEAAHVERQVADARAKGMEVIEGAEAREHMPYPNYLTGNLALLTGEIREALSERELKGKVKLLLDPHSGQAVEVVGREIADKARGKGIQGKLDKNDAKRSEQEKKQQAARERRELERDYEQRWRAAAVAVIRPRVDAGEIRAFSANLLRRMLLEIALCDNRCDGDVVGHVLDVHSYDDDLVASTVRALDDNEVGIVVLRTLLEGDASPVFDHQSEDRDFDPSAPVIEELTKLLDIPLADIKAKVQAEIRAERAPEPSPANEPAAPPEGSAKGGKKSSKPAARASKTTAEEAQASIAAALQALDPVPEGGQQDLATPVLKEAAAEASSAIVELKAGDAVKAKGGTVGRVCNGGTRKVDGKVGVVHMINAENSVAFRFGPGTRDLAWVAADELEHYVAMPTISSKVRVLKAGLTAERNELLWRQGKVTECRSDGWRVQFAGATDFDECYEVFDTAELEVLA